MAYKQQLSGFVSDCFVNFAFCVQVKKSTKVNKNFYQIPSTCYTFVLVQLFFTTSSSPPCVNQSSYYCWYLVKSLCCITEKHCCMHLYLPSLKWVPMNMDTFVWNRPWARESFSLKTVLCSVLRDAEWANVNSWVFPTSLTFRVCTLCISGKALFAGYKLIFKVTPQRNNLCLCERTARYTSPYYFSVLSEQKKRPAFWSQGKIVLLHPSVWTSSDNVDPINCCSKVVTL